MNKSVRILFIENIICIHIILVKLRNVDRKFCCGSVVLADIVLAQKIKLNKRPCIVTAFCHIARSFFFV